MSVKVKECVSLTRYESPCGTLILGSYENRLCLCDWDIYNHHRMAIDRRIALCIRTIYREQEAPLNVMVARQLDEYFAGERRNFDVPLLLLGTDFQKKVWQTMCEIPYGETYSYSELARMVGRPNAQRAVANACASNAISLFVPCHRVTLGTHDIGGYAGGVSAKKYLIELERLNAARGGQMVDF